MAKIRYTGKAKKKIPGIGTVTDTWLPCSEDIAREFENEPGFVIEYDQAASPEQNKPSKPNKPKHSLGGDPK